MLLLPHILAILAVTALLNFMPSLVRPDIFFGVTVQREFRQAPAAQVMIRAYRAILWAVTVVAVTAALVLPHKYVPLVPQIYGLCILADLAVIHRRAVVYSVKPATVIEVDLTAPAERLPGGPLVALVPLLWLVGLAIWSAVHVAAPTALLYRFAASAWMCLMLAAMAWGVLHWSRRVSTSGQASARERRFRRRVVTFVVACEYFLALPPTFDALNVPRFAKLGWAAAVLPIMGIGYTLNFGNPWAWLMLVSLFGVSLVVRTIAPR